MTNKQAQITINAIKFMLDNAQYSEDVEEALNMAINALTTQPETHECDCISRQAAIDAVKGEIEINGYSHVVDVLKQLPPAQPDNRLEKIADIIEGTIDHLDQDDAMDMLYQIKEVLK